MPDVRQIVLAIDASGVLISPHPQLVGQPAASQLNPDSRNLAEMQIELAGVTGTFVVGETVTQDASLATGRIVKTLSASSFLVDSVTGTFAGGDNVTGGTSGATGAGSVYAPVWTHTGVPLIAFDAVGTDGVSNKAITVTCSDTTLTQTFSKVFAVTDDTTTHTVKVVIAKDTDTTRFPGLAISLDGGTTPLKQTVHLDTSTGVTAVVTGEADGDVSVYDVVKWWVVCVSLTNNLTGNVTLTASGTAAAAVTIGTPDVAAVGSAVFGQIELHNKTIPEVEKLSLIYTEGAIQSTDALVPVYEAANLSNNAFAFYAGIRADGDGNLVGDFLKQVGSTITLTDVGLNTLSLPCAVGAVNKVGFIVHARSSTMSLFVNGTWIDGAYSGEFHAGTFDLGRLQEFPTGYWNIQDWHGGTVAQLKSKVSEAAV